MPLTTTSLAPTSSLRRFGGFLLLLGVASCAADPAEPGLESETAESETAESEPRESQRGDRICELFELVLDDDHLALDVWNNGDFHECPDDYLAAVDDQAYAVGGPRWRSVDEIVPLEDQPMPVERVEVPAGSGYDMFLAARVQLVPLATLEAQLGATIEALEDIDEAVRQMILSSTLAGDDYAIKEAVRAFPTRTVHHAGSDVFVLDDGRCRYAMKFYTSIVDPTLTNEDAVAQLGPKLANLPAGWSFEVLSFDEDLEITETDGIAHVVADELGNSYDRYECD